MDCFAARNRVPAISTPIEYTVRPTDSEGVRSGIYSLPVVLSNGQFWGVVSPSSWRIEPLTLLKGACAVSIEVAGPNLPSTITFIPNEIRGMIGWVISKCVLEGLGLGGFITKNISHLLDFINDNPTTHIRNYRKVTASLIIAGHCSNIPKATSSSFLTVSVTSSQLQRRNPGNFDPSIASAIASSTYGKFLRTQSRVTTPLNWLYRAIYQEFSRISAAMERGGSRPWWTTVDPASDKMTYECDAKLGSPQTVDCAQVEYQLDASSDTFQLAAGEVKFLSSSKCMKCPNYPRTIIPLKTNKYSF